MNDIEKAIMQLKELEIWCQDTSKIKESINLAIEALESQERLKIRLEPKEESSIKYYNEMRKYRDELKYYKKLEEQGRLVKLPCKVGDMVYKLEDYGEWQDVPHVFIPIKCQVELIYLGDDNKVYCNLMSIDLLQDGVMFDEIPINEIYLSKEEADKALEKERKNNG